jgi:hypothetical protein
MDAHAYTSHRHPKQPQNSKMAQVGQYPFFTVLRRSIALQRQRPPRSPAGGRARDARRRLAAEAGLTWMLTLRLRSLLLLHSAFL